MSGLLLRSFVVVEIGPMVRLRRGRVLFEQLHHPIDPVPSAHGLWIIFDFDIAPGTMILHLPPDLGVVEGEFWRAGEAATQQIDWMGVMANQAAPGALARQRTDTRLAEHPA